MWSRLLGTRNQPALKFRPRSDTRTFVVFGIVIGVVSSIYIFQPIISEEQLKLSQSNSKTTTVVKE